MANADNYSDWLVYANAELQWQDVCKSSSPSGPSLARKCAVQKIAQFGYGQSFNSAAEEEISYIFKVETRLGNEKYQANDSRIDRYWKRCKWSSSNSLDDFRYPLSCLISLIKPLSFRSVLIVRKLCTNTKVLAAIPMTTAFPNSPAKPILSISPPLVLSMAFMVTSALVPYPTKVGKQALDAAMKAVQN